MSAGVSPWGLPLTNLTRAQVLLPGIGSALDCHYFGQPRPCPCLLDTMAVGRGAVVPSGHQREGEAGGEAAGNTASSLSSPLRRGRAGRPGQ